MPQSFSLIAVHLVFSTKDRTPVLTTPIRAALHAYLATVARNAGCECFRAGGAADHVHLAISLSRTITAARMVEELKTSSSRWLKTQSPTFGAFAWQRGYAAFSVAHLTWTLCGITSTPRNNTTTSKPSRTSYAAFSQSTESNTMNCICGIDPLPPFMQIERPRTIKTPHRARANRTRKPHRI
jgi:REP element-mobilizing transposase RayT